MSTFDRIGCLKRFSVFSQLALAIIHAFEDDLSCFCVKRTFVGLEPEPSVGISEEQQRLGIRVIGLEAVVDAGGDA